MRKAIIGLVLLALMVTPAAADEVYNFLKQGYSFIEGDFVGGVGLFEPIQTENPPFDFDYAGMEVTWVVTDVEIVDYNEVGTFQTYELAGGLIGVYEDPDFDLDYGADPATGVATGSDGTAALTGTISAGSIFFNTGTGIGSITLNCMFNGGSRLAELGDLALQDWTLFDGMTDDGVTEIPAGYHTRLAGRIYTTETVAVDDSNLSRIRSLY